MENLAKETGLPEEVLSVVTDALCYFCDYQKSKSVLVKPQCDKRKDVKLCDKFRISDKKRAIDLINVLLNHKELMRKMALHLKIINARLRMINNDKL